MPQTKRVPYRLVQFVEEHLLPTSKIERSRVISYRDGYEMLVYRFPINQEIEGRIHFWEAVRTAKDVYDLSIRVGVLHWGVEREWQRLGGSPDIYTIVRQISAFGQEHRWREVDYAHVNKASVRQLSDLIGKGVAWATGVSDLQRVVSELRKHRGPLSRNLQLTAIGLVLANDVGGALRCIAEMSRDAWAARALLPEGRENLEILRRRRSFIVRFLATYDPSYIASLSDLLSKSGLRRQGVADALDIPDNLTEEMLRRLLAGLTRSDSDALVRDVFFALTSLSDKSFAAVPVAQTFKALARSHAPDDVLTAVAECFEEMADESAFDTAAEVVGMSDLGLRRAPFVRALGNMSLRRDEAVGVLVGALEDDTVVLPAIAALGKLEDIGSLPLLESFLDRPLGPVHDLGQKVVNRLRWIRDSA